MNILFEDNHILVVEKEAGIPTQPHEGHLDSIEERLKALIKARDQKKGNVFLHAIHRLDTKASGLLLFAKSQKALSRLNEEMRNGAISKEYSALVSGDPPKLGKLTHYLVKKAHKTFISHEGDQEAKKATLEIVSSQDMGEGIWLLTIVLFTGRYHQIRAQLAHCGCPIVGDRKYGSKLFFDEKAIALHHSKLSFIHPTEKRLLNFYSPSFWGGIVKGRSSV